MAVDKIKRAAKKTTEAEKRVADFSVEHRDSATVKFISTLSEVGDQPQMRSVSGALIAVGLLSRQPRLARTGVRMLLAHELATAIKDFIKKRVDRTRPRSAKDEHESAAKAGRSTGKEETSFPSGHTAGAVSVARAFARDFPQYRTPALAAAGAVGLAQVPRCAHYPTDVGAGAIIGIAAEAMVSRLWSAIEQPADPFKPGEPQQLPPLA